MRAALLALGMASVALLFSSGCGDDADYKAGRYWLDQKDNWQMAVKSFQRSLDNSPKRYKTRIAMLEALGHGDDPEQLVAQLKETLALFPDSARGSTIMGPAVSMLGEARYNKVTGDFQVEYYRGLIDKKGDKPELLSRILIAACRARDMEIVNAYLSRLIASLKGKAIPDSIHSELNFFIGPAGVERTVLLSKLELNPNDAKLRIKLVEAEMLTFHLDAARRELQRAVQADPAALNDPEIALEYAAMWGLSPFAAREIENGWDACRSADGSSLIYVKDFGRADDPDPYIYRGDAPIMKAGQQNLRTIAWPRYSPGGNWIYFYGSNEKTWGPGKPGRFQLYRVKPVYGAAPQKLTDDDLVFVEPCFESSGSALTVRKDIGSVRQSGEIIRISASGNSVSSVVRIGDPIFFGAFTPGGDSLIFVSDRGILKRSISGGVVSTDLSWQGFSYPLISHDGKWLLAQSSDGYQFLINRQNQTPIYMGQTKNPGGYFTQDGHLLVSRDANGMTKVVEYDLNKQAVTPDQFITAVKNSSTN